jgi:hypothetical protein
MPKGLNRTTRDFDAKAEADRIMYFFAALLIILSVVSTTVYFIHDAYAESSELRAELNYVMLENNKNPLLHDDNGGLTDSEGEE